jgi:hypothetical protein
MVRTARVELATSVWKTDTLPLRHARKQTVAQSKREQNWRRVVSTIHMPEGTERLAGAAVSPTVNSPKLVLSAGFEPASNRLEDGHSVH